MWFRWPKGNCVICINSFTHWLTVLHFRCPSRKEERAKWHHQICQSLCSELVFLSQFRFQTNYHSNAIFLEHTQILKCENKPVSFKVGHLGLIFGPQTLKQIKDIHHQRRRYLDFAYRHAHFLWFRWQITRHKQTRPKIEETRSKTACSQLLWFGNCFHCGDKSIK